ncbi:lysophospholipid acyltransferase family protein [Helicobacter sp.]|uniref:lysophospholipid acyltransferase family protein n=1 Tax=Helicobacter sp. TaxID=218 RepID=UPI0025C04541|nr:lysophospholipid acyltransferase family protein [Helicobacter sp.]MCI5969474.1 lysophospholipid acyltransferase family protein [Helicobacter sp.]MDY2584205.1 lysophospholipid acyltransferase family protein [Helicobacter sp.]
MRENFRGLKHKVLARILPFLLIGILRALATFLRFEFRVSQKALQKVSNNEPFLVAFWHGELFLQPFLVQKYGDKKKFWVLISKHFDGEIISSVVRYFGIGALRGSSSKGGIRALYQAIKKIESKEYVVITPDGPRGPYHSVADGVVLLAQKAGVPVVVSRVFYSNAWELKSWDRFRIPKPFSKVVFVLKDPFFLETLELEAAKALVKEKMEEDKCVF